MEKFIRFLFSATGDSKRAKNTVPILLLKISIFLSVSICRRSSSNCIRLSQPYTTKSISLVRVAVPVAKEPNKSRRFTLFFYIFYSRNPLISLIRDKIVLQLQLTMPGRVSMTLCRKSSISSLDEATACTCSLSLPVTR